MAILVQPSCTFLSVVLVLLVSCVLECNSQAQPTIQGNGNFIVGTKKTLACYITTTENVTGSFPLTWAAGDTPVTASREESVLVTGNVYNYNTYYTFTVSPGDNLVIYTCTARLPSGTKNATWTVYVYKPPDDPFISGPTSIVSGADFVWTCVVDGSSGNAPNVLWQFGNGSRLSANYFYNTANVYVIINRLDIHNVTSRLTLNVSPGNANFTLVCQAVHYDTNVRKSASISVSVSYPPVVNGANNNSYTAENGTTTTLFCNVTASPAITAITWYKNGVSINVTTGRYSGGTVSSPSLVISNLAKEDAGDYTCSGTNEIGSTNGSSNTLVVTYAPNVTYQETTVGGILGSDVTLTCVIDAVPPSTSVRWYRVNNETGSLDYINTTRDPSKYSGGTVSTTPDLTIHNLSTSDLGLYSCEATNTIGTGRGGNLIVEVFSPQKTHYAGKFREPRKRSISPIIYNRHAGDNLTLSCFCGTNLTRPCDYNSSVAWLKDSLPLTIPSKDGRLTGGSAIPPSLLMQNLQRNDSGQYECLVTEPSGNVSRSVLLLTLTFNPLVTIPQTQYTENAGENVTLTCAAIANPAISLITWYKDGQYLDLQNRSNKYSGATVSDPSLVIYNLTSSDGGQYTCQAINVQEAATGNITLNVEYEPVVMIPTGSYTQAAGGNVTLVCRVSANPPVRIIQWFKDALQLNQSPSAGKYSGSTPTDPSLTIHNLTKDDTGSYTCLAQNTLGTLNGAPIALDVTYVPVVMLSATSYTRNVTESLTLQCSIDAKPAATSVYWTKNSQPIDVNRFAGKYSGSSLFFPTLTINRLTSGDAGTYVCSAVNSVGTGNSSDVTVTVNYPPEFNKSLTHYNRTKGDEVTLGCHFSAHPVASSIVWYMNSMILAVTGRYHGGTLSIPDLTISNLTGADSATYFCSVTNSMGSTNSSDITLDVFYSPEILSKASALTGNESQSLTIPCSYDANPQATQILWSKGNVTVNVNSLSYTGGSPVTPEITIRSLDPTDAGSYVCTVINSLGSTSSGMFHLTVNYLPRINNGSAAEITATENQSVTLPCAINAVPAVTSLWWLRNNVSLVTTNASRYSGGTLATTALTILHLLRSDRAVYRCTAVNIIGTSPSQNITLNVTYAPTMSLGATIYTKNATQSLTILCSYDANPTPSSIQWTKNSQAIDVSNSSEKYNGSTVAVPSLTIANLTSQDAGTYMCSAQNSIGLGNSSGVRVIVNYLPEFNTTAAHYNRTKGGSVTLECHFTAYPAATSVVWYMNNINLISTGRYRGGTLSTSDLTISNLTGADSAAYFCSVTNSMGTTNSSDIVVEVFYPPEIVSNTSALSGTENTSLTIPCGYDAHPSPTQIIWTKAGVSVNVSSGVYIGGTIGMPGLTIISLDLSDNGTYDCTVLSQLGNVSTGGIPVTVTYFPKIDSGNANELTANETQSVTIPCTIRAVPSVTSLIWLHDNVTLNTTNPSKYGGGTLALSALTILNLQGSDAGIYRCRASNAIGSSDSNNVTVVVNYIPVMTLQNTAYSSNVSELLTISCHVDAHPDVTRVAWIKDSQVVNLRTPAGKYSGASMTFPSLVINHLTSGDSGNYVCSAMNIMGTGYSDNVTVVVNYPPEFHNTRTYYNQTKGDTVTLGCRFSAHPAPSSVVWYMNNVSVVLSGRYNGGTLSTPDFTISNLTGADTAAYFCSVTNAMGTRNSSSNRLDVFYAPEIVSNATAVAGLELNSSTIPCSYIANPKATQITWRKNGVRINVTSGSYAGGTLNNPNLTITSLHTTDAGTYQCTVVNSRGRGSSGSIPLTVMYSPKINPGKTEEITATEMRSVTIPCTVSAVPSLTSLLWLRDGNITDTNDSTKYSGGTIARPALTILNLQSSDAGVYNCRATNPIGVTDGHNVTLLVNYKPQITVEPTLSSREPQSVTIPCVVDARPAVTSLFWYKDGQLLNISDTTRYSGGTTNSSNLTILSVGSTDGGIYYCEASNTVGTTSSETTNLTVEYFPAFIISQAEVGGNLGQPVLLNISVTANPAITSLQWQKRDSVSNNYTDLDVTFGPYSGGTLDSPSLLINGLTNGDIGYYSLVATNSLGTRQSPDIFVDIFYAPRTPNITGLQSSYKENETVTLNCWADGFPPPLYRWYRIETFIADGATLTIARATPSDNSDFTCEAYNTLGEARAMVIVRVTYKPRPDQSLTNVSASIGQTVSVKCATDSNPPPTGYAWYHDGQRLYSSNSSELTVTIANSSMLGVYTCLATNIEGDSDLIPVYITNKTADNGGGYIGSSDKAGLSASTLALIIIICVIVALIIILIIIYCCITRRCFKKDNDVGPTRVAEADPDSGPKGSEPKLNGYYSGPIPPIGTHKDRINLDEDPVMSPVRGDGRAALGHGLSISVPGSGTPRPHHLPPLGQDGVPEETEPAREEIPKEKKKKRRRQRQEGEEDVTSQQLSPQHDPAV